MPYLNAFIYMSMNDFKLHFSIIFFMLGFKEIQDVNPGSKEQASVCVCERGWKVKRKET